MLAVYNQCQEERTKNQNCSRKEKLDRIPGKELRNQISILSRIFSFRPASIWREGTENYWEESLGQTGSNTKPKITDGNRLASGTRYLTQVGLACRSNATGFAFKNMKRYVNCYYYIRTYTLTYTDICCLAEMDLYVVWLKRKDNRWVGENIKESKECGNKTRLQTSYRVMAKHSGSKNKMPHLVAQLCPTVCHPIDCSRPGSSVHGGSYAEILEGVAMPSSRGFSQSRIWTRVSGIAGFTRWATREAPKTKCLFTNIGQILASSFTFLHELSQGK